jgi:hypothetical protein
MALVMHTSGPNSMRVGPDISLFFPFDQAQ